MSSLSSFRQQFAQAEAEASKYSSGSDLTYLKVEPGFNDFRLFPSLTEGGSFMRLRHVHKLEVEVTDSDGKKEIKRKHIFNSRTHGGTPKDIVDEYIAFAEKIIKDQLSTLNLSERDFKQQLKERMGAINSWQHGILPEFKWVGYALKLQYSDSSQGQPVREIGATRGVVDLAFSVGKKIDALGASLDRRGAVSVIDPFSDRNDGGILVINYDKSRDPADMYQVSLDTALKRPLTDEEMAWLGEQRTLEEQYHLSYTRNDFNLAVEGLQRFDQKNNYGVFKHDAFIAIVREISQYYPQDDKVPMRDIGKAPASAEQAPPPVVNSAVMGNQSPQPGIVLGHQQVSPAEAERAQLLQYIQTKGYPITVHPQHTNDQIREFINQEEQLQASHNEPPLSNVPEIPPVEIPPVSTHRHAGASASPSVNTPPVQSKEDFLKELSQPVSPADNIDKKINDLF